MIIQYFGMGMVKVSVGEEVICFAPLGKNADIKGPSFGVNVALVPINNKNYNGVDQVTHAPRETFVIDGPGEYEVNGTFIRGITGAGPDDKINTIFSVRFDDIHLVHLGALEDSNITAEAKELIGEADILFLPAKVEKLGSVLNPKIIVPLYQSKDKALKPIDKLVIKKKELESKEGEIIYIRSA